MEEMSRELVLTFGTDGNEKVKITISKPNADLVGTDIKTAMEAVVTSGALGDASAVDKVVGAEYVVRQKEVVDLEA